ncbi:MAG: hypothetical protein FD175_576 [Beijerinckiaceae bacterium]|nr:MAG: hypothetical protein FD175_576 [Beijerinckiaceae bacterium]
MRVAIAVFAFSMLAASTSAALEPAPRFDRDFNRAAKAANIQHRASSAECNTATCEFELKPTGRMSVVFDGAQKMVDEVAFYFPPEARSGADVIDVLGAVLDLLSRDQPKALREGVRLRLVEQAAGKARDGEFKLGRWTYVLRPNDGRDVRLYVRSSN